VISIEAHDSVVVLSDPTIIVVMAPTF